MRAWEVVLDGERQALLGEWGIVASHGGRPQSPWGAVEGAAPPARCRDQRRQRDPREGGPNWKRRSPSV